MKAVKLDELNIDDVVIVEEENGKARAYTVKDFDTDSFIEKGGLNVYPNDDDDYIVLENRKG
jgi:hypothetical protein